MRIRAAVVGLDSAFWPAAFHQLICDHPGLELVGACSLGLADDVIERDFVVPVGPWLAEREVARFHTVDDLLDAGLDAAFLCSRNSVMPSVAERLLDRGIHLYVAKPMALDAEAAAVYLGRDGTVVTGGQLGSTWEPWPTIRRLVDDGRIGPVLSVRSVHQHGDLRSLPGELWYHDLAEGDVCNWLGWYPVEAAVGVLGEVEAVSGTSRRTRRGLAVPDQAHAVLEHVDGRVSTIEALMTVGPWGMAMHEAQLVGERGIIRAHGPDGVVEILTEAGVERVAHDASDGLRREVEAFVAAVYGEGAPCITAERAVHVTTVCAAWRDSALCGGRVLLD